MSKAFREFNFTTLGPNSWLGEEALFSPENIVNYTLQTKTTVKVLEIGLKDLKNALNQSLISHL
jgi:CRP-like cAMP-binding protein